MQLITNFVVIKKHGIKLQPDCRNYTQTLVASLILTVLLSFFITNRENKNLCEGCCFAVSFLAPITYTLYPYTFLPFYTSGFL
jgi:hypothetical protein